MSNVLDGAFGKNSKTAQHLLTISAKSPILDIGQGSIYTYECVLNM